MTNAQPTTATTERVQSALPGRIRDVASRAWRNYWDWRARQVTVEILRSLDERTLRDIGLSPSEVESVTFDRPGDRRRRYHDGWWSRGCR